MLEGITAPFTPDAFSNRYPVCSGLLLMLVKLDDASPAFTDAVGTDIVPVLIININLTTDCFVADGLKAVFPGLIIPAGDLSMIPEGFTKYIQLHLSGLKGKSDFLSQETFKYVDIGDGTQSTKQGEYFSLGSFDGSILGKDYVCFDGTMGTFYARGVIIPENDFAYAVLTNNGNVDAIEYITMRLAKAKFNYWWMFWI